MKGMGLETVQGGLLGIRYDRIFLRFYVWVWICGYIWPHHSVWRLFPWEN